MKYKTKCLERHVDPAGRTREAVFVIDVPAHKRLLNFSNEYYPYSHMFVKLPRMHFYVFYEKVIGTRLRANCGIVFLKDGTYYYPTFPNVQRSVDSNICGLEIYFEKNPLLKEIAFGRLEYFFQSDFTLSNVDMFYLRFKAFLKSTYDYLDHNYLDDQEILSSAYEFSKKSCVNFFLLWGAATKNDVNFEEQLYRLPLHSEQKAYFDFYKSKIPELLD